MKESLFNIISQYIYDANVLDLFAGTGNLGIEALSRGARSAVFVDKSSECSSIIKDNLSHTKLIDKSQVFVGEVCNIIKKLGGNGKKFDIIFMDPPYSKNLIEETLNFIVNNDIIEHNGIVIVERYKDDEIPDSVGSLKLGRDQKYRETVLSFYVLKSLDQE